jgi:hypothetical protein
VLAGDDVIVVSRGVNGCCELGATSCERGNGVVVGFVVCSGVVVNVDVHGERKEMFVVRGAGRH